MLLRCFISCPIQPFNNLKELIMRIPSPKLFAQEPEMALLALLTLYLSPTAVFEDAAEWMHSVWQHLPPAEHDYFDLYVRYINPI
jgi:hypothetical protein